MRFVRALRLAADATRRNILPGLLLQALLIVFLGLYVAHDGTRQFLADVADRKREAGYLFAFVSYVLAAAVLPEILRIAFFQHGRPTRRNLWNFCTAAPAWGAMGMLVDLFYRLQIVWFGADNDWKTIVTKTVVDQLLFSPFVGSPLLVGWFSWRDTGFRRAALPALFDHRFFPERVFPVVVAGWCIWVPGVMLVYFMPGELQVPVASLIQAFWVLVFTLITRETERREPLRPARRH